MPRARGRTQMPVEPTRESLHRAWPPSHGWRQLSSFLCFPAVCLWAQEIHGVPIHSSARKASAPCPEVYPPSVKADFPHRAAGFLGSTRKEGKEHLVPHTVSASKIYPRNRHGRHSRAALPTGGRIHTDHHASSPPSFF